MHLVGVVLICNALDLYHHSIFAEQQMVHWVNELHRSDNSD